jgi:phosphate transport system substrate-binding protein
MKQLDGVFGTARNGGYDGSVYRNDYPFKRGADENIRTWGQLGATGEWADKPIHPCGQSPRANIQVVFQNLVLRGSDQWVEGYQAFANYATPEGTIASWSKQVLDLCRERPAGHLHRFAARARAQAQGAGGRKRFDGGPYVVRTLESTRDRSYPLINEIFFYANKAPGQADGA